MACGHYFVDEVGYQQLSEEDAKELQEDCFLLGVCINPECRTSICADNYTDSGEKFDGKRLLFSPRLQGLLEEIFVLSI